MRGAGVLLSLSTPSKFLADFVCDNIPVAFVSDAPHSTFCLSLNNRSIALHAFPLLTRENISITRRIKC
jgi:hypothetical protein